GFVMIEEEYRQREPAQVGTRHLWAGVDDEAIDPAIRAAMTGPTDTDSLFTYTLDRLLDAVLD
ncbi:MAG: TetR/AcrR family transcriptional regulator, partial [Acidimicrobiales bacterium]